MKLDRRYWHLLPPTYGALLRIMREALDKQANRSHLALYTCEGRYRLARAVSVAPTGIPNHAQLCITYGKRTPGDALRTAARRVYRWSENESAAESAA